MAGLQPQNTQNKSQSALGNPQPQLSTFKFGMFQPEFAPPNSFPFGSSVDSPPVLIFEQPPPRPVTMTLQLRHELFNYVLTKNLASLQSQILVGKISVDLLNKLVDKYGNTMLHCAAMIKDPQIASFLISFGVDKNRKNMFGKTAFDYAVDSKDRSVVEVFLVDHSKMDAKKQKEETDAAKQLKEMNDLKKKVENLTSLLAKKDVMLTKLENEKLELQTQLDELFDSMSKVRRSIHKETVKLSQNTIANSTTNPTASSATNSTTVSVTKQPLLTIPSTNPVDAKPAAMTFSANPTAHPVANHTTAASSEKQPTSFSAGVAEPEYVAKRAKVWKEMS